MWILCLSTVTEKYTVLGIHYMVAYPVKLKFIVLGSIHSTDVCLRMCVFVCARTCVLVHHSRELELSTSYVGLAGLITPGP